jgi:hypothetical protein
MAVTIKDMMEHFPKAIIIDYKRKEIIFFKEGQIKVYNQPFFDEYIQRLEEIMPSGVKI